MNFYYVSSDSNQENKAQGPRAAKKCYVPHGHKMLHVAHQLNTAANSIFAAFFCFLTIKYTFEIWFHRGACEEKRNNLTDEETFKLIEFYKENSELWVTLGITRNQKALQKEELVEEIDNKFWIEILGKAFHALRASFLRQHRKYQKNENFRIKVRSSTKTCFSWKTSQRPMENSIHMGPQIKFAAEK